MSVRLEDEHHPAPHRDRVRRDELAFSLFGGPLAWFLHLTASYLIASTACFVANERTMVPGHPYGTGYIVAVLIYGLSLIVAGGSILVSVLLLRRTHQEVEGDHIHLLEVGAGRTRFLAMCGLFLGVGFGAVALVNAISLLLVPACTG